MENQSTHSTVACSVCTRSFEPRFSYQLDRGEQRYYCSQTCRLPELMPPKTAANRCGVCGALFDLRFAYQVVTVRGRSHVICSRLCRRAVVTSRDTKTTRRPRAIAVMNHKGGTAKTTTSVSIAAGLAERGFSTLLIDLDAQGNVGVSLGIHGPKTIYDVLIEGVPPKDVAVPVRKGLDVITSDHTLADAEIEIVGVYDRARVLARRSEALIAPSSPYDYVILDCAPSLSLLNQNALTFAHDVIVPVSCDYLALVGVKQILRTLKHINEVLKHPCEILGVLPTFFDARNRICHQSVEALRGYFGVKVMPPIRINSRLKEAPIHKRTIFEYSPECHGAEDYSSAVEWLTEHTVRRSNRPA